MKKKTINYVLVDTQWWLGNKEVYDWYKEDCKERGIKPQEEDSEHFWNWIYRETDLECEDFFGNLKYSEFNDCPCMITGNLGLWWGSPSINAVYFNNITDAIKECISGGSIWDYEINMKDGYIEVLAKHHDGTNYFEIHLLSKKGIDRVECCDRNYTDYSVKPYWFKKIYGYLY